MSVFRAQIYEADSTFYDGELESLIVPIADGQYGVKANHRNTVMAIVPGIMKYRLPDSEELLTASVSEGMLRIEDGEVLILVNTLERPEEIDANRSRQRLEEAKEAMLQKRSLSEYYQAEAALKRAMIRLKVGESRNT